MRDAACCRRSRSTPTAGISRNCTSIPIRRSIAPRAPQDRLKRLASADMELADYAGMMREMEERTLVIDDLSHYEMERLLEVYRPAVFCAGIKEKYAVQKFGIPSKQLHSYDYGGPYAGFRGAMNFYREIDRMVNTRIWSFIERPGTSMPGRPWRPAT